MGTANMPPYGDDWHAYLQRAVGRFLRGIELAWKGCTPSQRMNLAEQWLIEFIKDAADWCRHWDEFQGTTSTNFHEFHEAEVKTKVEILLDDVAGPLGENFQNQCGSLKATLNWHFIVPVFSEGRQAFRPVSQPPAGTESSADGQSLNDAAMDVHRLVDDDDARHAPDFASVFWFGTEYEFTKAQAACVRVLWESLENRTPSVGQESILELAELNQAELRLVFRNHPAWGTMIVTPSKGR